jgi:hypothetical protein
MPRLSDLVNVDINRSTIKIQGVEIPVIFTFKSFPYVEEAFGKSYGTFEKEMNRMMSQGKITLGKKEIKLMHSLIYAMIKSGGTDCTVNEIESAIPLTDLPAIFQVAIELFNDQNFQKTDMDKLKTEKKN